MSRLRNQIRALDASRASLRRASPQKFSLGDLVQIVDGDSVIDEGEVSFCGEYDKHAGQWKYKVETPTGRLTWNENSLRLKVGSPADRAGPTHLVAWLSPREKRTVKSLREASQLMRHYIEMHGMGSSEWYGHATAGRVEDPEGKTVARVSYNGRVWDPADDKSEITNLD